MVGAPRSGAERGMKQGSSDAKKGTKDEVCYFSKVCEGLSFYEGFAVSYQLQTNHSQYALVIVPGKWVIERDAGNRDRRHHVFSVSIRNIYYIYFYVSC